MIFLGEFCQGLISNVLILQVKKLLDTTTYQKFSKLTCAYDKSKDLNQLLGALWEVMMGDGRNLKHLFRGKSIKLKEYMRLKVFTVMKIEVTVFWDVMPCSSMVIYCCFGEPCCCHL